MKPRIDGSFIFTACLGLFVLICLIEVRNLPDTLQFATNIAGYSTLALIVLLLIGAYRPAILEWTETALQDLWGGGARDEAAPAEPGERHPPWSAILRSMGYALGFLGFSFLFGFYLVPPIFLAFYLIVEARVAALWAITAGVIATALLMTGMKLVYIEVWAGVIPEIIPGYLGGAVLPPV